MLDALWLCFIEKTYYEQTRNINVYNNTNNDKLKYKIVGFILFFLVGLFSWLLLNTIFVLYPQLMQSLPEGQSLPSTVGIIVQLGNLFPFVYVFLISKISTKNNQTQYIITILFLLILAIIKEKFFFRTRE